jgi:hypothetical protein
MNSPIGWPVALILLALELAVIGACDRSQPTPPPTLGAEQPPSPQPTELSAKEQDPKTADSKEAQAASPDRGPLSMEQAGQLIADILRKEDSHIDHTYRPFLDERTTPEIRTRLKAQVFRVIDSGESYLIREKKVYHLGEAFGGDGVNSMLVEDLDQDGQPELWYTFNWGSGRHYSQFEVFGSSNGKAKNLLKNIGFDLSYDMYLRRNEQGQPEIWLQQFPHHDDNSMIRLGRLAYDKDHEKVTLALDEKLPEQIKALVPHFSASPSH